MAEVSMALSTPESLSGRGSHSWTSEEIDLLISLWRDHEELYDMRHVDYTKRDKRRTAFATLSERLQISVPEIKRKMTNLRTYYTKELWKERPGGKENDPSKPAVHSRWQYYRVLSFLRENCVAAANAGKLNDQLSPDYDEEDSDVWDEMKVPSQAVEVVAEEEGESGDIDDGIPQQGVSTERPTSPHTPLNTPAHNIYRRAEKRPKKSTDNLEHVIAKLHKTPKMEAHEGKQEEAPDPDLVFANHVGLTLMTIKDRRKKELAKLKIQQALFEAQYSNASGKSQIVVQESGMITGIPISQSLNGSNT